jgi:prepilin-type N-terminal cleavage/methylation domain-containing protein/prepilin-type processing-associated H-X9-DG protein
MNRAIIAGGTASPLSAPIFVGRLIVLALRRLLADSNSRGEPRIEPPCQVTRPTAGGRRGRRPSHSGFTLLELLVVIGIIAILMGLIIPVVGRVKESGRKTQCVSNLRQIGQALEVYKAENNQQYPNNEISIPVNLISNGFGTLTFLGRLFMGDKDKAKVFYCPSAKWWKIDDPTYGLQNYGVPGVTCKSNYWVRSYTVGAPKSDPSDTVAYVADTWIYSRGILTANHSPGANVLYTDGHVKWVIIPRESFANNNFGIPMHYRVDSPGVPGSATWGLFDANK